MVNGLQNTEKILNGMTSMVNSFLGNGQSSTITTNSIDLVQKKTFSSQLSSSVSIGQGTFSLPPACTLLGNSKDCSTGFVVQQVYNYLDLEILLQFNISRMHFLFF